MTDDLLSELVELFRQAHTAHAEAFAAVNGEDAEWPAWYANFLYDRLQRLLNAGFTHSELVDLLVLVDKQQRLEAPGEDWTVFYAWFFTGRYR